MTAKAVYGAIVQAPGDDAAAFSVLNDQVEREVLDIETHLMLQALLVERMRQGMPSAVGRGARPLRRMFAKFLHVAAEGALVNLSIVCAAEGQAKVLQFQNHLSGVAAHVLDRILIA